MGTTGTTDRDLDGSDLRIAIVASRYNADISERLVEGCEQRLRQLGTSLAQEFWVPGAFELPLAAKTLIEQDAYDAVVVLGVVIRGETSHYEYVCRAATDGLREVTLAARVPVIFGVLTTEDRAQALARAARPGESGSNKGSEAADAAVSMVRALREMRAS